jgi:hypothetical protein
MLLGARIDIFGAQIEKVGARLFKSLFFLVFSFQEWFSNSDAKKYKLNPMYWITSEEVDGVVVHSLGFSAEGSGFESRPGPSESMKLFSTN